MLTPMCPCRIHIFPPTEERAVELPSADRFDLEQAIMQCWGVVDDLKSFVAQDATPEDYTAMARVYQKHFEYLMAIFEKMLEDRKLG
jgi:hypothetical protein